MKILINSEKERDKRKEREFSILCNTFLIMLNQYKKLRDLVKMKRLLVWDIALQFPLFLNNNGSWQL